MWDSLGPRNGNWKHSRFNIFLYFYWSYIGKANPNKFYLMKFSYNRQQDLTNMRLLLDGIHFTMVSPFPEPAETPDPTPFEAKRQLYISTSSTRQQQEPAQTIAEIHFTDPSTCRSWFPKRLQFLSNYFGYSSFTCLSVHTGVEQLYRLGDSTRSTTHLSWGKVIIISADISNLSDFQACNPHCRSLGNIRESKPCFDHALVGEGMNLDGDTTIWTSISSIRPWSTIFKKIINNRCII